MVINKVSAFDEEVKPKKYYKAGICVACSLLSFSNGYYNEMVNFYLQKLANVHTKGESLTLFLSPGIWCITGMITGCGIAGMSMAYIGRKYTLQLFGLLSLIGTCSLFHFVSVGNTDHDYFVFVFTGFMFMKGLVSSVLLTVPPIYIIETVCKLPGSYESHATSVLLAVTQLPIPIGALTFTFCCMYNLISDHYLLSVLISKLNLILFCFLPESPRWLLLTKMDVEKAKLSLRSLRQGKTQQYDVSREIAMIRKDVQGSENGSDSIFRPFIVCSCLFLLAQLTGYELYKFYITWAFKFASVDSDPVLSSEFLQIASIVTGIILTSVYPGPKCVSILLFLSAFFIMVSLILTGFFFYMLEQGKSFPDYLMAVPLSIFLYYKFFYWLGIGSLSIPTACLITPPNSRTIVITTSLITYQVLLQLNQSFFILMINTFHPFGIFWLYGTLIGIGLLYVLAVVIPELKWTAKTITGEDTAQFLPMRRISKNDTPASTPTVTISS